MILREQFKKEGQWLFRWRSYVPLLFLPIFIVGLGQSEILETRVSGQVDFAWKLLCVLVSLGGFGIRCATVGFTPKGTSGRNTRKQIADELNTTGIYSVVRHPLYLGNALISFGVVMFTEVWWLMLLYIFAFWVYYERIMLCEEAFLEEQFGEKFIEWASRTPAFLPNFRKWQRPALPFSLRNVLRREYSGLYVIVWTFSVAEVLGNGLSEGEWGIPPYLIAIFAAGTFLYLALLTLKTTTRVLNVDGR